MFYNQYSYRYILLYPIELWFRITKQSQIFLFDMWDEIDKLFGFFLIIDQLLKI